MVGNLLRGHVFTGADGTYSLETIMPACYEPRQAMADILRPRYAAVAATQKPIIVAELGVSGTAAEQAAWLSAGARALGEFPRLQAVVYFNDRNAQNNWRGNQPDWQLKDPNDPKGMWWLSDGMMCGFRVVCEE